MTKNLITITEINGDKEYYFYTIYETENGNSTEQIEQNEEKILTDFFGDDLQFDPDYNKYWYDCSLVFISDQKPVAEQEIETLRKFYIT